MKASIYIIIELEAWIASKISVKNLEETLKFLETKLKTVDHNTYIKKCSKLIIIDHRKSLYYMDIKNIC